MLLRIKICSQTERPPRGGLSEIRSGVLIKRLLIDDAAIYGLAFERFSSQLGIHLFWHCMGIPAPAHRARHTSAHERCWAEAGIDPATKQIATANRTDLSIVPSHVMTFDYSSLFNRRGWKASILCGVYVTNNLIRNGAPKAGIGPTGSVDLIEMPVGRHWDPITAKWAFSMSPANCARRLIRPLTTNAFIFVISHKLVLYQEREQDRQGTPTAWKVCLLTNAE